MVVTQLNDYQQTGIGSSEGSEAHLVTLLTASRNQGAQKSRLIIIVVSSITTSEHPALMDFVQRDALL